ncbi:hypothetical protein CHE40_19885 [Salmonella enterica]|nr:hypothetical protein CHE40_19885 [Salmonella enterica]
MTTSLLLLKQRVINFVNISLLKIESKNHFCLLNFYYKCQWGVLRCKLVFLKQYLVLRLNIKKMKRHELTRK